MLKLVVLFSFFAIVFGETRFIDFGNVKPHPETTKLSNIATGPTAQPTYRRSHQAQASPKPRSRSIRSFGNVGHMGPVEILPVNHHKIQPIPVARPVVSLSLVPNPKKYHASPVVHMYQNHPKNNMIWHKVRIDKHL